MATAIRRVATATVKPGLISGAASPARTRPLSPNPFPDGESSMRAGQQLRQWSDREPIDSPQISARSLLACIAVCIPVWFLLIWLILRAM